MLYVEELVAPDAINTMPEATLLAFDDHGETAAFDPDPAQPQQRLAAAAAAGVELDAITTQLEHEGVAGFCASYRQLLRCIEAKATRLAASAT